MDCLCGKEMNLIGTTPDMKVWSCPWDGCGRLFLESVNLEINGTWYLAEKNDMKGGLY
jgi:hypothetical protein